jgi:acetyl-CoA carboxylase biotin carboxylase subunit
VRDDGGVYEGWEVSIYYDPMISKFAVHGRDRAEAIDRMRRALREYEVAGIKTTLPFFREVMDDEEFLEGKLDTAFIGRFSERRKDTVVDRILTDLAAIAAVCSTSVRTNATAAPSSRNGPSRWVAAGRAALHRK